jgi:hypothetical protein
MCVDFQYAFIFTPNQNLLAQRSLLTLILIINRTAGANSIKTMGFRLNNKITEKFLKKCGIKIGDIMFVSKQTPS